MLKGSRLFWHLKKKNKLVDLAEHLYGEIFECLKDLSYFKTFKVNHDTDTIEWDNGADMSPDFLYRIGKDINEKPQTNKRRSKTTVRRNSGKKTSVGKSDNSTSNKTSLILTKKHS